MGNPFHERVVSNGAGRGERAGRSTIEQTVWIPAGRVVVEGDLAIPARARALVVFVHGSGSSRESPRNRHVAAAIRADGFGTLLFNLLTRDEEEQSAGTAWCDVDFLARRLGAVTLWLGDQRGTRDLALGYFGASTGAAAALQAAAEQPSAIRAIVSRGGRPDLAAGALARVRAPTLLIVGAEDQEVLRLNRLALDRIAAPKQLAIVPAASHLFTEPGALDEVARLAGDWYLLHLAHGAASRDAKLSAEYKDGVLNVRLPKTEKAKPKAIPVKVS